MALSKYGADAIDESLLYKVENICVYYNIYIYTYIYINDGKLNDTSLDYIVIYLKIAMWIEYMHCSIVIY